MKMLNVEQGTVEWLTARSTYFCASEAAAMLGLDKRVTRNELLRLKQYGEDREFSEWEQTNLLDKGHRVEAAVRPLVEEDFGEDLLPVVGADDEGRLLLASFDGLTPDDSKGFECKQWNEKLAAAVRDGDVPDTHWPQLEHQLFVGSPTLEFIRFVVSDGTRDKWEALDYRSIPERRARLIAGWEQFERDLKSYNPGPRDAPRATADPVMALPAVSIQVQGKVALVDNLPAFGAQLKQFVEGLNKKPSTDQEFANAEAAVKVLERAEEALKHAVAAARGQVADFDTVCRTAENLSEIARRARLDLNKLVDAEKANIREQIRQEGIAKFKAHIDKCNQHLGRSYMPPIPERFGEAMKGKKTVAGLREAVDRELTRLKLEANEIGQRISTNMKRFASMSDDEAALFPDQADLVLKTEDDLTATIEARILRHQQRQNAERERLQQEEDRRVREAEERGRQQAQAEQQRLQQQPAPAPVAAPATRVTAAEDEGIKGLPIDEQLKLAKEEAILFFKKFGHLRELVVFTKPMGFWLNGTGARKRRVA